MLNISLLFIFTLTFFVRFPDGGRMSWYFLIGIACTSAQIAMRGINSVVVKPIIIVTVTLLYLRILFSWGILLSPYKTFLTNGYRHEDWMSEQYEYDNNYDNDKLYRAPLKFLK